MKQRTKRFALDVIKFVKSLPKNETCRVLGRQLLRAGTSVCANHRSAKRAKSNADFIHKMGTVEEEADECGYWLELLCESNQPVEARDCAMKVWSLRRTKNYGSKHHGERELSIAAMKLSADKRAVTLEIPDLAPTQCYELKIGDRVLHGTIHQLANP